MRYFRQTRRGRIRNSQIRRILNKVPVTEIFDRRELRCFGHLIRIDNNRKPRHLRERRVEGFVGKEKCKGRMGRTHVKADEGESEDLAVGDWDGIGQKVFRMWLTELHF
jgi:hypothetical protein